MDITSKIIITSVETVYNRIKKAKTKKNDKETINLLEELLDDIINERDELNKKCKIQEEKLYNSKITEEDIKFITDTLIPLIKEFTTNSKDIDNIEKLLSKDMINLLQIIGFDIKSAIGIPLTKYVSSLIISLDKNSKEESYKLQIENEILFKKLLLDENTRELAKKYYPGEK